MSICLYLFSSLRTIGSKIPKKKDFQFLYGKDISKHRGATRNTFLNEILYICKLSKCSYLFSSLRTIGSKIQKKKDFKFLYGKDISKHTGVTRNTFLKEILYICKF